MKEVFTYYDEIIYISPGNLGQTHQSRLYFPLSTFVEKKYYFWVRVRIELLIINITQYQPIPNISKLSHIIYIQTFSQAMIDICAEQAWLATVLRTQQLLQCIVQARWLDDPVVLTLPHVEEQNLSCFKALKIR